MGGNLMKVVICFIGTGKYLNFLPKYYENIEKYFLPNSEKTFLIFTDGELNDTPENMKVYYQEHLEWPYITLKRFEIIQKAKSEIEKCDWFVFLDADALVIDEITEEEFFDNSKLFFGVHHPCHYLQMSPHDKFPGAFETNIMSSAFVGDSSDTSVYYQGCLWGGKVPEVVRMIEKLDKKVNEDLSHNIVAVWHDESHLNRFLIDNKFQVKTLGPEFAFPEIFEQYCEFDKKIIHLAKDNSKYHK